MGKIIVFEGACDGIGKTTQDNLLCEKLIKDGYKIFRYKFPSYGEKQAQDVEKYLKGEYGDPKTLDPKLVHSFYANDRKVTWNKLLKEKYAEDYILILDRYVTSSLIYQSSVVKEESSKKEIIDYMANVEYNINEVAKPDVVIFLYADYSLAKKMREERKDNAGIKNDVHEKDDTYMRNVYNSSLFVADYCKFDKIKCDSNGKMLKKEEISNEIYKLVKKRI